MSLRVTQRVCASTAFHILLTHRQVVLTVLTPLASRSCCGTGSVGGEEERRSTGRGTCISGRLAPKAGRIMASPLLTSENIVKKGDFSQKDFSFVEKDFSKKSLSEKSFC